MSADTSPAAAPQGEPSAVAATAAPPAVPVADEPAPSAGRLVLQLVIFPLALVLVFAGIFLFFGMAAGSDKTFRQYLKEIKSGGVNQRWQAAYQLAMRMQEAEAAGDASFYSSPDDAAEAIATFQVARQDDPRIRQYLARVLGRLGDPAVVPPLVEVIEDEREKVETRFAALFALGMLGEKARPQIPLITRHLRSDDPTIRTVSAYVLGYMGDATVLGDLRPMLEDDDRNVRWNAALALARLGDDAGIDIIATLLEWEPPAQTAGMHWTGSPSTSKTPGARSTARSTGTVSTCKGRSWA